MKKELKNVLIFGATSDMASHLLEKLLLGGVKVYAVSRSKLNIEDKNLFKFNCNLALEEEIDKFFKLVEGVEFDAIINFQGIAISSPVECLKKEELMRQLDISLFSLVYVLKNLKNKINSNGLVVYVSSMASFGIFPFLSPYSIAKSAADTLLGCYEIETGIKTVSIKPGVVGTKFWKFCVNENKDNFAAFSDKYKEIGEFLKDNALKNSNKGIKPIEVSKLIYKIINSSNPKTSYLIGKDAYFASFVSKFKGRILYALIQKVLNRRKKGFLNEK